MKALVTGGAGFIGSYLVRKLVEEGHEVSVIDNLSWRKSWNYISNLKPLYLHRGDIIEAGPLKKQVKWSDVVYHLAVKCLPEGLLDPIQMLKVNDAGTFHLCMACVAAGTKLVYVSSCEAYGIQTRFPIAEDAALKPTTAYGASKAAGELWCKAFHYTYGLRYAIVRPFNAMGPRVRTDQYAPNFIRFMDRVRSGLPPLIYGDGQQTRDYIDVEEIAQGIYMAGNMENQIFNIARGEEVSVNQLAEAIIEHYRKKIEPIHVKSRPGDIRRFWADTRKARRLLRFKAKTPWRESLRRVIEWYEEKHKAR